MWRTVIISKTLFGAAVVGALFAGFNTREFLAAYERWPHSATPSLASRFAAWDAAHYLTLSQDGYEAGSHSCAFYPLWPAVIRAATVLTPGNPLLPGLLLANGLSVVAFWLFYRLVETRLGEALARDSLVLLLAFPGALFLSFPYSEPLFLSLVLLLFLFIFREEYLWAAVPAFLLPLTRAVGIFIAVPLAWHLYEHRRSWRHWLLLLAPLLGYAAYFGLMRASTGNAFEGFDAQRAYPNSPSIANIFNLPAFARAFASIGSFDGMLDGALDRALFIVFLAMLPLIYRLNKTWFWYALPTGLIPALSNQLFSYRRFIIVCFPVFIALAELLARARSRWFFWYYVVLLAGIQAWAVKQFLTFNWAG